MISKILFSNSHLIFIFWIQKEGGFLWCHNRLRTSPEKGFLVSYDFCSLVVLPISSFKQKKDHFQFPVNVKPNFWLHIHIEFSLNFGLAHKKNICTRPVDSCWLEMSKNYFLIFCFFLCHAVSPAAFLLSHFWGKVNKTLSQSHQGPALFPNSCFTLVSGVTDNVYFFPNTNSIWWNTDLKCYKCDCC